MIMQILSYFTQVSNVSDSGYVGVRGVVSLMEPFLQEPAINPHATLITLFMNAVTESMTHQEQTFAIHLFKPVIDLFNPMTTRVLEYLPLNDMLLGPHKSLAIKMVYAGNIFLNCDPIFDR